MPGKVLSTEVQEQFFSDISSNRQTHLVENYEGALWKKLWEGGLSLLVMELSIVSESLVITFYHVCLQHDGV